MSIIAAILLWIGAIFSPEQVNERVISENRSTIDRLNNDPAFLENFRKTHPTIVITEINEGD